MPALQVREFPDDLYDRLKDSAAAHHRSIAQQTIVAVEMMLREEGKPAVDAQEAQAELARPPRFDADTEAQRLARANRRRQLFAEIDAMPKFEVPADFPSPAELLRQIRDERDEQIHDAIDFPNANPEKTRKP